MHKIACFLFIAALILCFAAKLFKRSRRNLIKAHIITGALSLLILLVNMSIKLLSTSSLKYIGFLVIFILIGITGYMIKKNRRVYRNLHIISTILFPIYLILIIIF